MYLEDLRMPAQDAVMETKQMTQTKEGVIFCRDGIVPSSETFVLRIPTAVLPNGMASARKSATICDLLLGFAISLVVYERMP